MHNLKNQKLIFKGYRKGKSAKIPQNNALYTKQNAAKSRKQHQQRGRNGRDRGLAALALQRTAGDIGPPDHVDTTRDNGKQNNRNNTSFFDHNKAPPRCFYAFSILKKGGFVNRPFCFVA